MYTYRNLFVCDFRNCDVIKIKRTQKKIIFRTKTNPHHGAALLFTSTRCSKAVPGGEIAGTNIRACCFLKVGSNFKWSESNGHFSLEVPETTSVCDPSAHIADIRRHITDACASMLSAMLQRVRHEV